MKTLHHLLVHELKDLYSAADYLHQVLKRLSSSATHPELVQMLDTYYNQVEFQKDKLQEFFAQRSIDIKQADSPIMSKIRDHSLASMRYQGSKEVRDLTLLLTVNIMKHFEITSFGTVLTHANRLNDEDITDMLLSLKAKIAEDEQKPIEIASKLMEKADSSGLKTEIKDLLGKMVEAQVKDEDQLLKFITELIPQANSNTLTEALETYQSEHENNLKKLTAFSGKFQNNTQIDEWSIMDGYVAEWKNHLSSIDSEDLKDIGILISVQRIQHQNIALFEFENLFSEYIENAEMQKSFDQLLQQESGNDQSFTAIAEGSIFSNGLDAKVQP